jgi:hypothetical protein
MFISPQTSPSRKPIHVTEWQLVHNKARRIRKASNKNYFATIILFRINMRVTLDPATQRQTR